MRPFFLLLIVMVERFSFGQPVVNYAGKFDEPFRPAFHFTPQTGWMNDPNGLVYYNHSYHLFYQYYPDDIVWGPMHWGHAVSSDLLHWKHLPIALYPDSLGWIFSGSAVIDKQNTAGFGKDAMVAIFTYHSDALYQKGIMTTESQGIAFSIDEGKTWNKYSGNPVIKNPGEKDFRDPKAFWNDDTNAWNLVLAAGNKLKIYASEDLKNWNEQSDFEPPVGGEYGVWECPDLFKMKTGTTEKWVLIVSQTLGAPNGGAGTRYFIGDFNGKVFSNVVDGGWFDYGKDYYAAVTYSNVPGQQRILLGWMSNWQYANQTPTKLWRSAMALPRELMLVKNDGGFSLKQKIIPQFQTLETPVFNSTAEALPFHFSGSNLSQSEISFALTDPADEVSIEFSNAGGEVLTIRLNEEQLSIDRSQSGIINFSEQFAERVQTMPVKNPVHSFQLIMDRSSIEILLNNGQYAMTNQLFPKGDMTTFSIQSRNAKKIEGLQINAVKSVWAK